MIKSTSRGTFEAGNDNGDGLGLGTPRTEAIHMPPLCGSHAPLWPVLCYRRSSSTGSPSRTLTWPWRGPASVPTEMM